MMVGGAHKWGLGGCLQEIHGLLSKTEQLDHTVTEAECVWCMCSECVSVCAVRGVGSVLGHRTGSLN